MLEEGVHKVKSVIGCFTGESGEKKTPYFGIEFETVKGETTHWVAYLSDKVFQKKDGFDTTMTKENMKTLVQLGFVGRSLSDLSDASKKVSDLFAPVEGITITIEHEVFDKEDGTQGTSAKVKWVNVGYGPNKFDHKQAVVKFKSLGLDGELLKLQKELGSKNKVKTNTEATTKEAAPADFNADDIPF